MRKYIFHIILTATLLFSSVALAAVFSSQQVGTNPVNGYFLQTNGVTSTWAAVSGGPGGSGGVGTSSPTTGFAVFVNGNTITGTSSYVFSFNGATGTITYAPSTTIATALSQLTNDALFISSSSLNFGPLLSWNSQNGRISFQSSTANGSLLIGSTGGLWNQTTLAGNLPVSIVNGSGTINIQIATGTQATNGILIAASSTNYDTAYFLVNNSSTNWNRAWTIVNASSANYDTAYAQRATTTIAIKLSQLTNDPGFSSTTKVSQLTNDSGFGSSTAGKYLDSSNQSAWTVSSTIVSSTVAFSVYDATSTLPYAYQKAYVPFKATLVNVFCDEYAAATSTMELVRVDTNGTTTQSAVMLYSIGCGVTGSSTASFNSSTVPAGTWLMTIVSSTAGTPTYTNFNAVLTKQ